MSEEAPKLRVGYIGLGLMGKHMARNILRAGFPLVVHNRSRASVEELAAEGAIAAASPAELAAQVDVVMTNVPDSCDVLDVVFGPNGVAEGIRPGSVFVDNSTIKPTTSRDIATRLAAQGVAALDAPVSGGDVGARDGTLAIMVGGDAAALERVAPVLAAIGKKTTRIGDAGAGQVCKAANQIMVANHMAALGEMMMFVNHSGVDPGVVSDAIQGGAARCYALAAAAPGREPRARVQGGDAVQGPRHHHGRRGGVRGAAPGHLRDGGALQGDVRQGPRRAGPLRRPLRPRGQGRPEAQRDPPCSVALWAL